MLEEDSEWVLEGLRWVSEVVRGSAEVVGHSWAVSVQSLPEG